jgi:hypothetical protein
VEANRDIIHYELSEPIELKIPATAKNTVDISSIAEHVRERNLYSIREYKKRMRILPSRNDSRS